MGEGSFLLPKTRQAKKETSRTPAFPAADVGGSSDPFSIECLERDRVEVKTDTVLALGKQTRKEALGSQEAEGTQAHGGSPLSSLSYCEGDDSTFRAKIQARSSTIICIIYQDLGLYFVRSVESCRRLNAGQQKRLRKRHRAGSRCQREAGNVIRPENTVQISVIIRTCRREASSCNTRNPCL